MTGVSTLAPKWLVASFSARADSVPCATRIDGEKRDSIWLPSSPSPTASPTQIEIAMRGWRIDLCARRITAGHLLQGVVLVSFSVSPFAYA
jgi:hypothetical protein